MHLGVRKKLTIAMLAVSIAATIAMGAASQYGFRRGFVAFLNEQGSAQLDIVLPQVVALYERTHSWDYLRGNPLAWFITVGIPGGGPAQIPDEGQGLGDLKVDVTGSGLRMTLFDASHTFLIGFPRPTTTALTRPVVSEGRTVGWLTLQPVETASNGAETRFQRGQLALTWIIGLLAIAFAAIIAFALSNAFLVPLRRIGAVTERLAAGEYSARLRSTVRDEFGQLSNDVDHLARALESTEALRRHFMADISHELRTPLAVLRAEVESLLDGVRKPTPESLTSLLAEVTTLGKLVDDVHQLAIADVGALTFRKEPVDVCAVLGSCVEAFRDRFEQARLQLSLHCDPRTLIVQADEGRLLQLFNNLLENALRYTDAGGRVACDCTCDATHALVRIRDSAPAVSDESLPHLFERFFRVDSSRNRQTGGSGLGLAICRSIVEAHGGTIRAEHSDLGGVCVLIRLAMHPTP